MKIVVCGAGLVGMNIAQYLVRAGHDVTVIDQRQDLARKLGENLDIKAVAGHASHPDVLERAGAADADMLIAVTYADEVNMLACQVAHTLFEVPTKIARIRQQAYLEPRWNDLFRTNHIPIDVIISPELEVARAIARRLAVPGALEVVPFADDLARLIAVRCHHDCPMLDTPLKQLGFLFPDLKLTTIGIVRDGRFFVPTGDDQMLEGDEVFFVVATAQIERAMSAMGYEVPAPERCVIAGGGNVGWALAGLLHDRHPRGNIKIIEWNAERAADLAVRGPQFNILLGDARENDVLSEANIGAADAMIGVTNDDEVNIMAALLAKRLGCPLAFTLINHGNYAPLLGPLGIDVAINPRETTVSSVLQHVRRGRIRAVRSIVDGAAEVFEAEALETSPLVGIPLRDAHLPGGVIVAAVVRGREVITPRGETVVHSGDRVVVAARSQVVRRVEKLFAVRLDYF
ncbi:MAG: Trk system potassium transporter TrkA [Geminicoccaceae bacterium]|nr:MAG: Trk system potassium transporter TrkA [Geminicoccaceae bacterium]